MEPPSGKKRHKKIKARRGMPHSTKDICGDLCDVCKVGRAHVVYIASRHRFFFGCNASTKDKPCKGSKSWQSIDVPQALRVLPEWAKGTEEVEFVFFFSFSSPASDAEGSVAKKLVIESIIHDITGVQKEPLQSTLVLTCKKL